MYARIQMDIEALRLAWRPASEGERLVVGTTALQDGSYVFRYDGLDLQQAIDAGFHGYPGLPVAPGTAWNGRAMEAFQARLPQSKRPDREHLLGLWGVSLEEVDPIVLLGATGGRLVTDAFEFLPVLRPVPGTRFLTPAAGCRYYDGLGPLKDLRADTPLELVSEPSNSVDPRAVRLEIGTRHVGYLRKVVSDGVLRAREAGLEVSCKLARPVTGTGPEDVVLEIAYG